MALLPPPALEPTVMVLKLGGITASFRKLKLCRWPELPLPDVTFTRLYGFGFARGAYYWCVAGSKTTCSYVIDFL